MRMRLVPVSCGSNIILTFKKTSVTGTNLLQSYLKVLLKKDRIKKVPAVEAALWHLIIIVVIIMKELLNVDTLYLLPGEERCVDFRDANGVPKVHYTYCSFRGRLFNCTCCTKDEAQRLCEDWLIKQDRCYIN